MNKDQRDGLLECLHLTTALLASMTEVYRSPRDDADMWKYSGYRAYARKYNQLVEHALKFTQIGPVIDRFDMNKLPESGDAVLPQHREYFGAVHANVSILKAFLESILGTNVDEVANLSNFLQANLRRAVFDAPEKEVEVQDIIERLLIGRGLAKGIDYDRETGRVKVSVKEVIPDFIFPRLALALEVKLSRDPAKSRTIVDEINADIKAYGKMYDRLIFVVYDTGSIRDELEFKQDLETAGKVDVLIVKH